MKEAHGPNVRPYLKLKTRPRFGLARLSLSMNKEKMRTLCDEDSKSSFVTFGQRNFFRVLNLNVEL
jgi:hypothetical protein